MPRDYQRIPDVYLPSIDHLNERHILQHTVFHGRKMALGGGWCYVIEGVLTSCPACHAPSLYSVRCYGQVIFEQCKECGRTRSAKLVGSIASLPAARYAAMTIEDAVQKAEQLQKP